MIPADAIRSMQALAAEVFALEPERVDLTPGELAYFGAIAGEDVVHRLWFERGEPVAWALLSPGGRLEWQVHPGRPALLDDVLDWAGASETAARHPDDAARLEARGFAEDPDAPFMRLNVRDLDAIDEPLPPPGHTLCTVADLDGIAGRVAVHRAAWAEHGTRVTEETYPRVQAAWPYRADLDFVALDPHGTPVSFALGWYDERNRVGEFEPVGTDPRARRLGLARAVSLFGLRRFREAGAARAIVGCRGDDAYPVPCLLYESLGFRELSRQRIYRSGSQPS